MSLCMQMGWQILSLLRGPLRAGMHGAKHVTIAMHGCKTKLAATQRSLPILSRYAAPHLYLHPRKEAALPTQCHMQERTPALCGLQAASSNIILLCAHFWPSDSPAVEAGGLRLPIMAGANQHMIQQDSYR